MCCVQNNYLGLNIGWVIWYKIMIYIKNNMWFYLKHVLRCTYDISQKNWIDTFYKLLFTDEWTKSNHKTIELCYSTHVYTYCFHSLILVCIIPFFDDCTKPSNRILQCSDIKYNVWLKSVTNFSVDMYLLHQSGSKCADISYFYSPMTKL